MATRRIDVYHIINGNATLPQLVEEAVDSLEGWKTSRKPRMAIAQHILEIKKITLGQPSASTSSKNSND